MVIDTTDTRSHSGLQILNAVIVIGRSQDRLKVFEEIYRGSNKGKTAEQISEKIGMEVVRVLQEALILSKAKIIGKQKIKGGKLMYIKDPFFSLHKEKIIKLATDQEAKKKFEIKINPSSAIRELPPRKTSTAKRKTTKKIKILFLTANPKDTVSLRLDEELREIEQKIMLAQKKEQFDLVKKGAVQVSDLQLYLNQENPVIVHFSGHGTDEGSIVLEDKMGYPIPVSSIALKKVFETHKDDIRCVVLNACFSLEQAQAINNHIDFVIGMASSIDDDAAIAFSYAFYLAISSKRNVKNSFDQGISEMLLQGYADNKNTPKLLCRNGIDATKVFIYK
jgi:CHAT domain-containing protein